MTLRPADDAFETALRTTLHETAFRPLTATYLEEPRGAWRGSGGLVVAPATTAEVAATLAAANDARVPVIPFGGGTGLVGGQISPDLDRPLILSLERMTAIREVSPEENVMVADAGAILDDLRAAAEGANRLFPLQIAASGSSRIGGNLATNAGGTNVLRYGNARDLCLGIEAVLPDGRVMNLLTRLRKDNTGYDLRNLLIGSEGTLAIITACALKLFPRPNARAVALLTVPSPRSALALLARARDIAGDAISAFELISGEGLRFLADKMPQVRQPFPDPPDWCVLIDLAPFGTDPEAQLETLVEQAFEAGEVLDGLVAQSDAQAQDFWALREMIPEANRQVGAISSHDISLPLGALPGFIDEGREAITALGPLRLNCFGHLGDGNLHYNVFPPKGEAREAYLPRKDEVMRTIHDLVHAHGGSISAEHGIGRLKADDLRHYGDPVKLEMMRGIKRLFDPNGILNPGAVLARG